MAIQGKTISELDPVVEMTTTDEIALVQNGVTYNGTLAQLQALYDAPQLKVVTLETASILLLNTTPIATGIGAPGAGLALYPVFALVSVDFNAAAYATNTTLGIRAVGATHTMLQDTEVIKATVDTIRPMSVVAGIAATTTTQVIENVDLEIFVDSGDPTAGDSPLNIYIYYKTVTLI